MKVRSSRKSLARRVSNLNSPEDELFLQPWFIPKDIYLEIRRLLPPVHLAKMRYYFQDYGCLKCSGRTSLYASNGFCEKCSVLIRGRVVRSLQRRLKDVGVRLTPDSSPRTDPVKIARQLLRHDRSPRRFTSE